MENAPVPAPAVPNPFHDEVSHLLGVPPLQAFLSFMKVESIGGSEIELAAITEEWRNASQIIGQLPPLQRQAPTVTEDIHSDVGALADDVVNDPVFKQNRFAPVFLRNVDLRTLLVLQKNVNLRYVRELKSIISQITSPTELFRFCMNLDGPWPDVTVARTAQNRWTFSSQSTDFRALEARALEDSDHIGRPSGLSRGGVVVPIGYGTNHVSAFEIDGMLVLNNGTHRAYALRDSGVLKIPCMITKITHAEELGLIVGQDVNTFLQSINVPRPPMLEDFFSAGLHREAFIRRRRRQITITYSAEVSDLPVS